MQILFRDSLAEENELAICREYFGCMNVTPFRSQTLTHSTVIGRYSVLPFYEELEQELKFKASKLINSYQQHLWMADCMAWGSWPMGVLAGFTPQTWNNWANLPNGSFIVKGKTNSKKHSWNTHMFAKTKEDVPLVASRLLDDQLISEQGLVVREYIPLKQLGIGVNGLPITNEWRTFWISDRDEVHLLAKGFYWTASHPELAERASWVKLAEELVFTAAKRVSEYANFFVLDVAETKDGSWIVIEVNDAQMSGLCGCDPHELYRNLRRIY